MRKASVALVIVVLLATGACGDDEAGGETTTTAAPPATATTGAGTSGDDGAEDEWAIPDEIDEAYVERVLTKLYEIQGEATRLAIAEGIVPPESIELLNQVYEPEIAAIFVNILVDDAFDSFDAYRRPPRDIQPVAVQVIAAQPDCVWAVARLDHRRVMRTDEEPRRSFHHLVPITGSEMNPTGWLISSVELDVGEAVASPCG